MFRVDGSVKVAIGDLENPKLIWELLEQWYVAKQKGLKSILRVRLQIEEMGREGRAYGLP